MIMVAALLITHAVGRRWERKGLTFPFTDEAPKKFTGVGAGNTDTDARVLPFVDHAGDRQVDSGAVHSSTFRQSARASAADVDKRTGIRNDQDR